MRFMTSLFALLACCTLSACGANRSESDPSADAHMTIPENIDTAIGANKVPDLSVSANVGMTDDLDGANSAVETVGVPGAASHRTGNVTNGAGLSSRKAKKPPPIIF